VSAGITGASPQSGGVVDAEDVPEQDVRVLQRLVVLDRTGDTGVIFALGGIGAAGPLLVVMMPGVPAGVTDHRSPEVLRRT